MDLPPFPDVFGNYAIRGIEEIQAPGPVSWLPQTLGWQVLAGLLLLWLLNLGRRRWQYWRRNRYRKFALLQLKAITTSAQESNRQLAAIAALLKATALQAYPRKEIAALSGSAWLDWLDQRTARPCFSKTDELLTQQLYRDHREIGDEELKQLTLAIATWIREHREPGQDD